MKTDRRIAPSELVDLYLGAKQVVIESGFGPEVDWQETRHLEKLSESEFLQECAWVVTCSGMKEAVVRKLFPRISVAFKLWKSADTIVRHKEVCRTKGLSIFGHGGKIAAILANCEKVANSGFDNILEGIREGGPEYLMTFDFIGPVTCYHLAKNIGLQVVKPDRHLVRISRATGFASPLIFVIL